MQPMIDLPHRYALLASDEPGLRARDAAERLGVSEAELVAANAGRESVPLAADWKAILARVPALGPVMALTRNAHIVHEKTGTYDEPQFDGPHGLVLGPDIDLRIFLRQWAFGFAVTEEVRSGHRRSLQFFDAAGTAIHKIYLTEDSDPSALDAIVADFRTPAAALPAVTPPASDPTPRPDETVDLAAFRADWDGLRDTHEFFPMLRRHELARTQALRLAGPPRADALAPGALRGVLEAAAASGTAIMVFVGNRGIIQIHTGPVRRLVTTGPWINVLDPGFSLHAREDRVAAAWRVRKPTADGTVTSVELFDAEGGQIALLFGARKPGHPEDPAWRALAEALPGAAD